jgi:hypothetical protein
MVTAGGLVIASGGAGAPAFFRNVGNGGFTRLDQPALSRPVGRDLTSVLGFGSTVFFGSANHEDGQTNGGCVRLYDLARLAGGEIVLGPRAALGRWRLAMWKAMARSNCLSADA